MGKIVKKFFEYVKEDLNTSKGMINPDLEFDDMDDDFESDYETSQNEDELEYPTNQTEDNFDMEDDEFEEEEPGYEGGRMLQDLAKKLGKKVINNEIEYNGSTITCYSEDNKFRLNDQIIGSNVDQAFKNIQGSKDDFSDELPEQEIMERKSHRHSCKCGKCK